MDRTICLLLISRVWLKPCWTKQCSTAHSHHQSGNVSHLQINILSHHVAYFYTFCLRNFNSEICFRLLAPYIICKVRLSVLYRQQYGHNRDHRDMEPDTHRCRWRSKRCAYTLLLQIFLLPALVASCRLNQWLGRTLVPKRLAALTSSLWYRALLTKFVHLITVYIISCRPLGVLITSDCVAIFTSFLCSQVHQSPFTRKCYDLL